MPKPIKRRELIRRLRLAGLAGPEPGGGHEVMRLSDGRKVAIPNPHKGDRGPWMRLVCSPRIWIQGKATTFAMLQAFLNDSFATCAFGKPARSRYWDSVGFDLNKMRAWLASRS